MKKFLLITLAVLGLIVVAGGTLLYVAANVETEEEQTLTPEQAAQAYAGIKSQLDVAVDHVTAVLSSDETKAELSKLAEQTAALQALRAEYDSAKGNGAAPEALRAISARYGQATRDMFGTLRSVMSKVAGDRQAIMQATFVLSQLDPQKWAADAPAVTAKLETVNGSLRALGPAMQAAAPVISRANQVLGPRRQAGLEVTEAEEVEAFTNAAAAFLAQPPAPAQPAHNE